MATKKSALASAKAKLAKVARGLKKGDSVTITDRLYAVVDAKGRLAYLTLPFGDDNDRAPHVYNTRLEARATADTIGGGARVIRLGDISGIVQ
jgi:hypothetical protein